MEGMKCEQHVLGIVLGEEPPDFGMFLCPTLGRPLAVRLFSYNQSGYYLHPARLQTTTLLLGIETRREKTSFLLGLTPSFLAARVLRFHVQKKKNKRLLAVYTLGPWSDIKEEIGLNYLVSIKPFIFIYLLSMSEREQSKSVNEVISSLDGTSGVRLQRSFRGAEGTVMSCLCTTHSQALSPGHLIHYMNGTDGILTS